MKKQTEFNLQKGNRGGRRDNAGRKRIKSSGVSHDMREIVSRRFPLHINLKFTFPLRTRQGLEAMRKSIANARAYISILHYSLESNHIHLIIEADNNQLLEKGMRSFTNTFVKIIRKGSLQKERYHLHVLRAPREAQNAFRYVLLNHAKHVKNSYIKADLYSSLHTLDLKEASEKLLIPIIAVKIINPFELDEPSSWLARNALRAGMH